MNKESKSFEEALNELEKITTQLKSGDTSLEDTLKLYEEGIAYYKLCKEIIEATHEKIKIYDKELEDFREKEYGI